MSISKSYNMELTIEADGYVCKLFKVERYEAEGKDMWRTLPIDEESECKARSIETVLKGGASG